MPPRVFQVKSGWLADQGSRLDAAAYGEGGLAARDHIKAGPWPWCPLSNLAHVFNESRFTRTYVQDPTRGVRYLTGSDMLLNDLQGLLLLSSVLRLKFAGNIGRVTPGSLRRSWSR